MRRRTGRSCAWQHSRGDKSPAGAARCVLVCARRFGGPALPIRMDRRTSASRSLYPLAVGSPELAPVLLAGSALLAILSAFTSDAAARLRVSLALAVSAAACRWCRSYSCRSRWPASIAPWLRRPPSRHEESRPDSCHPRRQLFQSRWCAAGARCVPAVDKWTRVRSSCRFTEAPGRAGRLSSQEWFSRHFAAAGLSGRRDRLSPRARVEVARTDRRCSNRAVLDFRGSTPIRR